MAKVEVHCINAITEPGGGTASLTVERGTDMERVAELAVEAIWRSRLDPLNTISVDVGDGEGAIARDYIVDKEHPDDNTADLEAKYGPRPGRTG